jgi:hypothetical protein
LTFHATAAKFTGADWLAITKEESDQFAEAYSKFARHYPQIMLTQKQQDTGNFLLVLCMIYGTRIFGAMQSKKKNAADANNTPQPTKVFTVHDPSLPGGKAEVEVKQ